MRFRKCRFVAVAVNYVFLMALLAGCTGQALQARYYALDTLSPADMAVHNIPRHKVSLGVGPIMLPDYLKRMQIVTRAGANRYQFSDSHRWAGLLEENILTVLGSNLGALLGTTKIASYPWLPHFEPDFRVTVEVLHFDADLSGDALLDARWAVSDGAGEALLDSGRTVLSEPLKDTSYEALVKAESQLLADLSKELSRSVSRLLHN